VRGLEALSDPQTTMHELMRLIQDVGCLLKENVDLLLHIKIELVKQRSPAIRLTLVST
jgi:hypothetical protein